MEQAVVGLRSSFHFVSMVKAIYVQEHCSDENLLHSLRFTYISRSVVTCLLRWKLN
jgi:hypothetical protein